MPNVNKEDQVKRSGRGESSDAVVKVGSKQELFLELTVHFDIKKLHKANKPKRSSDWRQYNTKW